MLTHYDELGVREDASREVISTTYKRLAAIFHPDNQVTGNEEKFKRINEAYSILGDSNSRREYDRELRRVREEVNVNTSHNSRHIQYQYPQYDENEILRGRIKTFAPILNEMGKQLFNIKNLGVMVEELAVGKVVREKEKVRRNQSGNGNRSKNGRRGK